MYSLLCNCLLTLSRIQLAETLSWLLRNVPPDLAIVGFYIIPKRAWYMQDILNPNSLLTSSGQAQSLDGSPRLEKHGLTLGLLLEALHLLIVHPFLVLSRSGPRGRISFSRCRSGFLGSRTAGRGLRPCRGDGTV